LSDFVVEGGFDDRAILEGFKKIVTAGTEAGRKVGAGFEDELNRFGKRSVASLQAELGKLQSRQLRVNVDSSAFAKTEARIQEIQKLIDLANKKKLLLNADPGSVVAVRQRLQEINQQLERVAIGSRSFNILRAQAQAAERQLGLASRQTKNIAGDLLNLALPAAGTLGAILALGQALRFVADQARLFDSAGAAVRTLGVDSEILAERLKSVSRETGGARSEIELLQAAYDVASSGFADAASASQILEASARGATGGFSDINTVANATTSVLNAYGLSADQASTLVDKFIQTQNDGKITVAQLAQQIGKLAPIAASAGVSIDEFGAAIAAATVAGVQPEAAVTGLRQAISNIIKPTAEAEAVANRLGIGFGAAALKSKGLSGVLSDIAAKTKGSAALNLQLFGTVEALTAVQPLLNDELERYNKFLGNQQNSAGVAQKATEEVANTVEGATKRIQGSLSNFAVELGKLFTPATIKLLDGAAKGIEQIADNYQQVIQLAGGVEVLAGAVQKVLEPITRLTGFQQRLVQAVLGGASALARGAAEALGLGKGLKTAGDAAKGAAEGVKALPATTGKAAVSQEQFNASLRREVAILREVGASREALTKIQQQVPLGNVSAQLQGAQALFGLASALANLEESRFATVRARNQFEIDNAAKLGITQEGIAQREAANLELQRQGLVARYQATLQQQQLEQATLGLKQRQAQIEAQLLVLEQQRVVVKAQQNLANAEASLDPQRIADAKNLLEREQISLGLAQQKLGVLNAIAPIERAIGQATAETARQQLLAQGAALGIEQQLRNITPLQQSYSNAWREIVQNTAKVPDGLDTISRLTTGAAADAEQLGRGFIQVGDQVKTFGDSKIDQVTDDAAGSARSFAGSMDDAAGSAQRLLQYLSAASGLSPARFTGGPVEGGGRYRINDGPGGRSLGQESFLSRAGDLSLIRNPLNSMWTAPSAGIVLPAAMTDTLKQRGAFAPDRGVARRAAAAAGGIRPGGAGNTARLELAITHLTAKVDALARKDWNVTARVRTSNAGGQLRILNATL
jgi:TP901 family phage tail tape measure protein